MEGHDRQRLLPVPSTLVAQGGTSLATFREFVMSRKDVVTSIPHVRMHHLSGVSSTETSDKKTESEVEILIRHSQQS